MISLVIRRLLFGVLTIWASSVLVFAGTELLPGDVATAILGQNATSETVEALREQLGLDRPPVERYFVWLSNLIRLDLGRSLASERLVVSLVGAWLWNTLKLALVTALVAVPISVTLGLLSATRPDGLFDRSISVSSLVAISVPEFFTASLLVLIFAVTWRVLPAVSYMPEFASTQEIFRAMVLPVVTLTLAVLSHMTRMTRAAILNVLRSSYVEMAILTGVPRSRIILRHALPNALGPIINVIALNLGYMVSGVVVVEAIFAYPGLGRLLIDAVAYRDIPMVQAVAMIFCAFYIVVNLLADLLILITSPRLRAKN
jgi:peptide/nickel transport system permease protein